MADRGCKQTVKAMEDKMKNPKEMENVAGEANLELLEQKARILSETEEMFPFMQETRRHLHMNPELSEEERATQAFIMETLSKHDISYKPIADTGVLAWVDGQPGDVVVGLRADIDALPIQEQNDCAYRSRCDGVMHACGHDAHTTIALATAISMQKNRHLWRGQVKFFFQPAEETVGGAKRMVDEGCLKAPDVDYCIGLHVMPHLDCGEVELKYGALNAATDSFEIKVSGLGGHGAVPDKCVDSVVIAAQIVLALQTFVSRNVSPRDSAVLTIGKVRAGSAGNVIAESAVMAGTLRSSSPEIRALGMERLREIAEGTAAMYGGQAQVVFEEHGYPALINDDEVVDVMRYEMVDLWGKDKVVLRDQMSMGGEDFSFFCNEVPSAFYHVGCKPAGREVYTLHSSDFDIDENCMLVGLKSHLAVLLHLLTIRTEIVA